MTPTASAGDSGGGTGGGSGGRHTTDNDAAIAALLSTAESGVSMCDSAGGGENDSAAGRGQVPTAAPAPFTIREGFDVTVRDGPGKAQQVRGAVYVCFVVMVAFAVFASLHIVHGHPRIDDVSFSFMVW